MDSFLDGLAKLGLGAVLQLILTGLLVGGAAILGRNWVRRGKVRIAGDQGHTCMSPLILLTGLLCAGAATAFLVLGLLDPQSLRDRGQFIAWAGLVGGFSLAFLLILPYSRHAWEWDPNGLSWRGAWRSVSIPWSHIDCAGKTWDGRTFVADADGRRICWSCVLEHQALRDAIARRRPDIMVPAA